MSERKPETGDDNQVDVVLQDYLNDLLVAATAQPASADSPPTVTELKTRPETSPKDARPVTYAEEPPPLSTLPRTLTVPDVETPQEDIATEVKTETPAETVTAFQTETVVDEPALTVKEQTETETPPLAVQPAPLNWRSVQGIECLIFKVAGLKLAIPLPLLGGVHNVADKVTPLFGQAAWSLGVWQGEDGKMTIIDSAKLIMPERNVSLADDGYSFFIQLDRSPWALACQEICDTVTLVYDSIKWRGETSKRPWLAGTVISEMCALVDVNGLMTLLEQNVRR
tara:strand:- start:24303 stop:25151 length:849 start_codon:yes stop_codon:yes gene_type:complete